jgi:hypothetical protein
MIFNLFLSDLTENGQTKVTGSTVVRLDHVFIRPSQVPARRKVTYAHFVCTMRPGKAERYRIRMTMLTKMSVRHQATHQQHHLRRQEWCPLLHW